ncbi:hypothetical protein [Methylobacterium planeticum]|uniref:Uncharacterized protein n=1 Tax=Methylobacterium planeticum TaxID=2615211 RepID=A0A6N6MLJ1_9HYPH|nr:hypothetical protein [Methylobacterium planeticum]KAB1071167.1 hypothetical protein F6X51_19905 [Methylobacterium planeticum]
MAISVRYYVFEEAGPLRHVPRRVSDGLYAGEDTIPAYASTQQRIAEVIVENEDGKPARLFDARGRY